MKFTLLCVDDDASILSSLKRLFGSKTIEFHSASNAEAALEILQKVRIDASIVDLKMPGMDGLELLQQIKEISPLTKAIILTGYGGVPETVKAMNSGAIDFIEKPFCGNHLKKKIADLISQWDHQCFAQKKIEYIENKFNFPQLVGNSPPMLELKDLIVTVGAADVSVLIQGESGTGKELVAESIHRHSRRSEYPLVGVDCASLGETLIQSELFGHVKGAFTGALNDAAGLIRTANKGTLFLDEIGEIDISLQAKLLRTIQQRKVRPVGGNKTYDVDVRIVAATNRDLGDEVKAGNFREDLYYRLNTVSIKVPPLRSRPEDISMLVEYFIKKYSESNCNIGKTIHPDTLACLQKYQWPGNIRELENVINRALVLFDGPEILPSMLPENILEFSKYELQDEASNSYGNKLSDYEKLAILNALKEAKNVRRRAAQILGIGEATFYRKLRKYGLY